MADAGSFLEQARRDRERLTKPREEAFSLPGYSTLRVRYGVLSYAKTKELAISNADAVHNGTPEADADLVMAAESLLESCKGFDKFEDGKWQPWAIDGKTVKYDDTLVTALGIELPAHAQPRDIVYGLFGSNGGNDPTPVADRPLMNHYFEVLAWMDNANAQARSESVGKSERQG